MLSYQKFNSQLAKFLNIYQSVLVNHPAAAPLQGPQGVPALSRRAASAGVGPQLGDRLPPGPLPSQHIEGRPGKGHKVSPDPHRSSLIPPTLQPLVLWDKSPWNHSSISSSEGRGEVGPMGPADPSWEFRHGERGYPCSQ